MESQDMKKCPFCAELIRKEAIKCRYCGSMLTEKKVSFDFLSTPGYWNRVSEGKKVAGVCTGISRQLDAQVLILPLRVFFILTTIFYGFGFILYIILWALMAPPTDGPDMNAAGTTIGHTSPPAGPVKPTPPPKPEPDDDFDYIEGSTPAPEEYKPESASGDSPEKSGDSADDTGVQKRVMLWGMIGALSVITFFAGKAYIALVRELMLPIPFQVPLFGILLGMTILALLGNRNSRRQVPVRFAAD